MLLNNNFFQWQIFYDGSIYNHTTYEVHDLFFCSLKIVLTLNYVLLTFLNFENFFTNLKYFRYFLIQFFLLKFFQLQDELIFVLILFLVFNFVYFLNFIYHFALFLKFIINIYFSLVHIYVLINIFSNILFYYVLFKINIYPYIFICFAQFVIFLYLPFELLSIDILS